jgi:hypothetical protein
MPFNLYLQLLNFDSNVYLDPALHSNTNPIRVQLPQIMQIPIRNSGNKRKNFYKTISPNSIDVRIQVTHVLPPVGEDGVIVVYVKFLQ